MIDKELILEEFKKYTAPYDISDPKIRLKVEHTYRVAGLCHQIGESICLNSADTDLAWVIGMLHDIGRFEQLRLYNTFVDADSIDHASFGVKLLFEDGLINTFLPKATDTELSLLLTSILNHSLYRLPAGLSDKQTTFCNILRDADKIDILRVNVDFSLEDIYNCTRKELMESEISPKVLEAFNEGHAVPRVYKKTPVDFVVAHIAMVQELVYPKSRQILNFQGYIDKLLDFKSDNPHTREHFLHIKRRIRDALALSFK